MACTGRYAQAYEFAAMFCGANLKGTETVAGLAHATLTDTQTNFVPHIKANVGMICYNLTTGLSGAVTAVSTNSLTVTGVTWSFGDFYRVAALDGEEIASIEMYLDIAASDLHAALAGANACACTFATWANAFLAKLNVIDAAVYHGCSCGGPNLTDERRQSLMDWMTLQLDNIRTGKLELCAGATGSDFPSIDWAEQSSTAFAAAEIIINRTP
jgi:hypothetical protein